MSFTLIIDFIVIALLVATIMYATILNRKMASLYQNRAELQQFLTQFTASLAKAEQSMHNLKKNGETAFATVHEHLQQALALRDDLSFLVERGEAIANRLDETIHHGRHFQKDLERSIHHIDDSARFMAPGLDEPTEPEFVQALRHVR
jgi:biopolymer transport protein ExbB/TolQ